MTNHCVGSLGWESEDTRSPLVLSIRTVQVSTEVLVFSKGIRDIAMVIRSCARVVQLFTAPNMLP